MTYVGVYRPRRRREWQRPAGLLVFVLGLVALVSVADRPSAPPPPPPPRAASVGDLLHAGRYSAVVLGILPLHSGSVLVAVRFVRGPAVGGVVFRVEGCPDAGDLVDLNTGTRRAWERGAADIFSAVAAIGCGEPTPASGVAS
jgi:hypothetical protein